MIRIKDHKTRYLFDPFAYLGPKRRKMIDQSWAGIFRKHILRNYPSTSWPSTSLQRKSIPPRNSMP